METVRLDELFDMRYGHSYELVRMKECSGTEGVNFVSRTGINNGVTGRVLPPAGKKPGVAGEITVAMGGTVLATFVQDDDFVCGRDIKILTPKRDMSMEERLYYARCVRENAVRYSYGRQANRTLPSLQLPATPPDWVHDYSVDTILGEFDKAVAERDDDADAVENTVDTGDWVEFRIGDLFDIKRGNVKGINNLIPGDVPVVSAKESDNGIAQLASVTPQFDAGTISISVNGAVGYATVQQKPWSGTGDVMALLLHGEHEPTVLAKFAVCTLIREESQRFGYARKLNQERLENMTVRLPAVLDESGDVSPDWDRLDAKMQELAFSRFIATQG